MLRYSEGMTPEAISRIPLTPVLRVIQPFWGVSLNRRRPDPSIRVAQGGVKVIARAGAGHVAQPRDGRLPDLAIRITERQNQQWLGLGWPRGQGPGRVATPSSIIAPQLALQQREGLIEDRPRHRGGCPPCRRCAERAVHAVHLDNDVVFLIDDDVVLEVDFCTPQPGAGIAAHHREGRIETVAFVPIAQRLPASPGRLRAPTRAAPR